jgi:hypothetical protein
MVVLLHSLFVIVWDHLMCNMVHFVQVALPISRLVFTYSTCVVSSPSFRKFLCYTKSCSCFCNYSINMSVSENVRIETFD